MVGRWLLGPARVLLLDEPFRGVDLGARRDIAAEVRELAAAGGGRRVAPTSTRCSRWPTGSWCSRTAGRRGTCRANEADREALTLAMNA